LAADSSDSSQGGRSSKHAAPPLAAASWSRRVIASFSPVPSAMTAAIAGQRNAKSIAQARSSTVVASISIERSTNGRFDSSAPIRAGT